MRFFVPLGALGAVACQVVVEFPWDDTGETSTADEDSADDETGEDSGEQTTPPTGHFPVDENVLCTDCHEADRIAPDHYTQGTPPADCGPCHSTASWSADLVVHPVKRPHGAWDDFVLQPREEWVVACSACHTDAPLDYTTFGCVSCHGDLLPHAGVTDPATADSYCLACHPTADLSF